MSYSFSVLSLCKLYVMKWAIKDNLTINIRSICVTMLNQLRGVFCNDNKSSGENEAFIIHTYDCLIEMEN